MSIERTIERFIVNELIHGNKTNIDPDESLISGGILDSLALLRLIAFIEEQFGVNVDDGEVVPDNFQTVSDIKAFLQHKMQ